MMIISMQIVYSMLGAPRVGAPVVGVQGGSLPLDYLFSLLPFLHYVKV
jgi:hypothetical protein